MESRGSLAEQEQLTETLSFFSELVWHGQTWMSYLERTNAVPDEDIESLRSLTMRLADLLDRSPAWIAVVKDAMHRDGPAIQHNGEAFLAGDTFSEDTKHRWSDLIGGGGGVLPFAQTQLDLLLEKAPKERSAMLEQLQAIVEGDRKPKDPRSYVGLACEAGAALYIAGCATLNGIAAAAGVLVMLAECF